MKKQTKIIKICKKWNKHKMSGNKAMYEIWELLRADTLKEWRKYLKKIKQRTS
jgi:hypothetical protein